MMRASDRAALEKIRECIKRANAEGRDVVEYLYVYGWLATPSWQEVVEADLLDHLSETFEAIPAQSFAGGGFARGEWSLEDVKRGVMRSLEDYRDRIHPNG